MDRASVPEPSARESKAAAMREWVKALSPLIATTANFVLHLRGPK